MPAAAEIARASSADVGAELVLGVVFWKRVPRRADAVLVGVEKLALALVAEHAADD